MQRNRKLGILAVLMTVAILVWVPGRKRITNASATISPAAIDQTMPMAGTLPRKRTEFADWGRDPFARPQRQNEQEKDNGLSNLRLAAIIWSDEKPTAFVNDLVIHVGDRIADKTVKRIEQNSVILTDGTKDYVLRLQE
jgi:hypothetical protein